MEADGVVEILKMCKAKGKPVGILDGDDDTSAITKARREVDCTIEKASDKCHLMKNCGKQLHNIKSSHPELTNSVMNYFQKNFKYMVSQNEGNVEGIVKGKKAVVEHAFGVHTYCDSSWCGYLQDPTKFKHKGIPGGADLKSPDLKRAVEDIYDIDPEKLAFLGSSQQNENTNSVIGSKAPKRLHYGSSNSIVHRVQAAVLQKNEGYTYVPKLLEKLCMSPGRSTEKRAQKLDHARIKKSIKDATPKAKLRRQILKSQRNKVDFFDEIQEGVTYKSNMMLKPTEQDEYNEIPPVMEAPTFADCPITNNLDNFTPVFFDLETTSLERDADILQIAAVTSDKQFNEYMVPRHKQIKQSASNTHKITYKYGVLKVDKKPVDAVFPEDGLNNFLDFICSVDNPVLIGHNIKLFDCPVLHNKLDGDLWSRFKPKVIGYVDTLPVFKETFPGQPSYSESELVKSLLKHGYDAHNAMADVIALQELCQLVGMQTMKKHAFSLDYVTESMAHNKKVKINVDTFSKLVQSKVCSAYMANKMASSGLKYGHLTYQVKENGYDGLEALLKKETHENKPRATNDKRVIKKLFDHIHASL